MSVMRREFTLALLLGAVGAGLILLATRQAWAHAVFVAPRPLPAEDFSVSGQEIVPLASALALAALACLAAVIATRSVARRAVGVLLAVLGAGAGAAVTTGIRASAVIAAAKANTSNGTLGGSTTSGSSPGNASPATVITGSSGHAVMVGAPWRAVAVVGAVAIILAGLATIGRGSRWPVMSARFDRSPGGNGGAGSPPVRGGLRGVAPTDRHDSATMWESLSRDIDPTLGSGADTKDATGAKDPEDLKAPQDPADSRTPADQLDGGIRS
jgi:uncharacterized membrane protein (TIGR02234 family)